MLIAGLGLGLTCAYAPPVVAHPDRSALVIQPAFLPVPHTMDQSGDPTRFRPALPSAVLHEFLLLPGWVKAPEFEALVQWLVAQGFVIQRAIGPEPWRTYPNVKFHGTVRQFNQAFHIAVMSKLFHPRDCYAVFTDWMMPARFAPKGESYIEGYSFSGDGNPGVSTLCR